MDAFKNYIKTLFYLAIFYDGRPKNIDTHQRMSRRSLRGRKNRRCCHGDEVDCGGPSAMFYGPPFAPP
jgi:hypothetical protein